MGHFTCTYIAVWVCELVCVWTCTCMYVSEWFHVHACVWIKCLDVSVTWVSGRVHHFTCTYIAVCVCVCVCVCVSTVWISDVCHCACVHTFEQVSMCHCVCACRNCHFCCTYYELWSEWISVYLCFRWAWTAGGWNEATGLERSQLP